MADIRALQDQLRQLRDYYSTQPDGERQLYQKVAEYAHAQGFSPEMVNQVIQGVAPNPGQWSTQRVQSLMDQYGPTQYGLSGATTAAREGLNTGTQAINTGLNAAIPYLQQGQNQALAGLGATQNQVSSLFKDAQLGLQPFINTGTKAHDLQAALSGALGPEAQKAAFAQYQESPGVDYARQQSERAITRNAAALGGLGGGNVMSELSRNAVGLYLQDFNNQFARTGQVADRGYSAAGLGAGLKGQEAGIQSSLGQMAAQIPLNVNTQIADMQFGAGNTIGAMNYGTGNTITGLRYQTGQDIANSTQGVMSAISALAERQGIGMADITGKTTTSINDLYARASAGDSQAIQEVMAMIGNLSTGGASMVGGLPIIPGAPSNYLGQLGQVAGGAGGLAAGLNYGTGGQNQSMNFNTGGNNFDVVNPSVYQRGGLYA